MSLVCDIPDFYRNNFNLIEIAKWGLSLFNLESKEGTLKPIFVVIQNNRQLHLRFHSHYKN